MNAPSPSQQPTGATQPPHSVAPPGAPALRLLVIDDDPRAADAVRACLGREDIGVDFAWSLDEVKQQVQRQTPALALLELGVSGGQGFDILKYLGARPDAAALPVFILSFWQESQSKARALDQGAVDYVVKPFDPVEMRARINAALRRQAGQGQWIAAYNQVEDARLAAVESTRMKAGFLASMSHEIRTPMNGVIAMTGLLQQTQLTHEQHDFVETIRASGESLLTIINDILNFSKIEAGKMELEHRPFKLRSCIEETLDMVASKASEKCLDLLYRIAPDTPTYLVGDIARLRQVLVNLVGNAVKFTSRGEVCVEAAAQPLPPGTAVPLPPGHAPSTPSAAPLWEFQFSVRDTGIGIAKEHLSRLFQCYNQADSSISRDFGGTGLGLAISKGLVELMGGRMWVESEVGRGSAFQFSIPSIDSQIANTNFTKKSVASLDQLPVLIVDDNETTRQILAGQLARWGMVPQTADTAKAAIEWCLAGHPCHLAVLEMELSNTTGQELAKTLRSLLNRQRLPIVLVSNVGTRPEFSELLPPDITAHVTKPFKPESLQAAVLKVLPSNQRETTPLPPPAPAQAPSPATADQSLAQRYPLRILITDDNIINQKVASRLLRQVGYQADIAQSGREAIQALERKPYDVVFMDVQMPDMNGLEAARQIRELQLDPASNAHFKQPIAIVAMTANAMQGDREKCLAAGMDEYIAKPVRPETLQRMLEHFGKKLLNTGQTGPAGEEIVSKAGPLQDAPASPSDPVQAHPNPVDLERLMDFSGGTIESLEEIIGLYVQQTSGQLEQMSAAVRRRDAETIGNVAHSCAGASATCGMIAIVALLRRLEMAGKSGDLSVAATLLEDAAREFARIKLYLETKPWDRQTDTPNSIAI